MHRCPRLAWTFRSPRTPAARTSAESAPWSRPTRRRCTAGTRSGTAGCPQLLRAVLRDVHPGHVTARAVVRDRRAGAGEQFPRLPGQRVLPVLGLRGGAPRPRLRGRPVPASQRRGPGVPADPGRALRTWPSTRMSTARPRSSTTRARARSTTRSPAIRNANGGCDLEDVDVLGTSSITATARYPYKGVSDTDKPSDSADQGGASLFTKYLGVFPKGPGDANSNARIVVAHAQDVDGRRVRERARVLQRRQQGRRCLRLLRSPDAHADDRWRGRLRRRAGATCAGSRTSTATLPSRS